MVAMPFFFVRLGVKKMLAMGMLAWALRYDFSRLVMLKNIIDADSSIIIHGVCYDFFLLRVRFIRITLPAIVLKRSPGFLLHWLLTGVGMLIGFTFGAYCRSLQTSATSHNWQTIWLDSGWNAAGVCYYSFCFSGYQSNTNKTGIGY